MLFQFYYIIYTCMYEIKSYNYFKVNYNKLLLASNKQLYTLLPLF